MAEPYPRIEELRRRVLKDPSSIAFAQLAEEYRRAGAFDEAVAVCRTGLSRHPGYLSARVTLGRALLELDRLDEGQGELVEVLANAPENLAALRGLAEIFHRREIKESLTDYRQALDLAGNDPDLQQLVADLTAQAARLPQAGPATPAPMSTTTPAEDPVGLVTLEELTAALQQIGNRPSAELPADIAGVTHRRPARRPATTDTDLRQLAIFERWLTAIDGFRAEFRA